MIQSEVRRAEEHARQTRSVEMGSQGACTAWNTTDRKLTWGEIWKYEPLRLSFRIRSVYDLLPTPANLCRWGLTDDPKCSLCDRPGTLEHVLSTCSTSLTQGRYRKRHDAVLRVLSDWLENERKKERGSNPKHHITFDKPGETMTRVTPQQASIFDGAIEWNMEVDLGRRLTVPWETRCEEAYERKKAKYTELVYLCRQRGWRTWLFPVEVGVRRFCSQSICWNNWKGETNGYPETKSSC